jgi:hypothetical protein
MSAAPRITSGPRGFAPIGTGAKIREKSDTPQAAILNRDISDFRDMIQMRNMDLAREGRKLK